MLWVLIWINYTKNKRTFSDIIDKITQNIRKKEGWDGVEEWVKSFLPISPTSGFKFLLPVGIIVNYSFLNF